MDRWPIENHDVNVNYVITIVFCHCYTTNICFNLNRDIAGTINVFTDDALILNPITTDADALLQKYLDTLHPWCQRWIMQFNASNNNTHHLFQT